MTDEGANFPPAVAASGAFHAWFQPPIAQANPSRDELKGLTFTVKDLIDIKGTITGAGNPTWKSQQYPAASNAVVVDQCLNAGAAIVGKVHTDEFAFSLEGKNHYYGIPSNPKAPHRIPGGSSSGSVSSVANGLCDFSLGTDTNGSVRVPASNCGVFGLRPTWGRINTSGVFPFAPHLDTVGFFARNLDVLSRVAKVLLEANVAGADNLTELLILTDGFAPDFAEEAIRKAMEKPMEQVKGKFKTREVSFAGEFGFGLDQSVDCSVQIQHLENWSIHGNWIEKNRHLLTPFGQFKWQLAKDTPREDVARLSTLRERIFRSVNQKLGANKILVFPTTPLLAPPRNEEYDSKFYYARCLKMTSIASVARCPQISIPIGYTDKHEPIGLSLVASQDNEGFLLDVARKVFEACGSPQ